jgi:CO/xanthine dehydrogenase FAD-binding subunit
MGVYLRPQSLDEALRVRAHRPLTPLAGGTDVYPAQAHLAAWNQARDLDILDLSGLETLRGIAESETGWRLGAATTWTDVVAAVSAGRLPPVFRALAQAARTVGGLQIQNRGTLAGNLCNASPAADSVPPLLALDTEVELASLTGTRRLPLADFVLGNRQTALRPDELVVALNVPRPEAQAASVFLKLGARAYQVISIVMTAGVLEVDGGAVKRARLAVGSCSAAARRLPDLEAALVGAPCDASLAARVLPEHLSELTPIDDVRGTAAYRRDSAVTLVRRALAALAEPAEEAAA